MYECFLSHPQKHAETVKLNYGSPPFPPFKLSLCDGGGSELYRSLGDQFYEEILDCLSDTLLLRIPNISLFYMMH